MQANVVLLGKNQNGKQFVLENGNDYKIVSREKNPKTAKISVTIESLMTQVREVVACEHDKQFNVLFQ